MDNNYITITDIQPLVDQGLTDVKIGEILSLHKTSIGKIKKGIITKSRQLGFKNKENKNFPIWEYVPADYPHYLADKLAKKISWLHGTVYEDILDFVLDFCFYLNENSILIQKLKQIKTEKEREYFLWHRATQKIFSHFFALKRRKEKRIIINDDSGVITYS